MFKYIKKNFERPENGLMQIIITHVLFFCAILFLNIIDKLVGRDSVSVVYKYVCLWVDGLYFKPWTLVTYGFVHNGLGEFVTNLAWLYSFGRVMVYLLGSKKFLRVYFIGSIVGGLAFFLAYSLLPYLAKLQHETSTGDAITSLRGCSIALYAVIAGLVTFAPNFVLSIAPFFSVKVKHLGFFILMWPVLSLSYTDKLGQEAVDIARLASALSGYLYIKFLLLLHDKTWREWLYDFYVEFRRRYEEWRKKFDEPTKDGESTSEECKPISEKEVEEILDKIALCGYEKLSKEEKHKLFDAGRK